MICPRPGLGSLEREGAGNAGCALHPRLACNGSQGIAHEHTGSAEMPSLGFPDPMHGRLRLPSQKRTSNPSAWNVGYGPEGDIRAVVTMWCDHAPGSWRETVLRR